MERLSGDDDAEYGLRRNSQFATRGSSCISRGYILTRPRSADSQLGQPQSQVDDEQTTNQEDVPVNLIVRPGSNWTSVRGV